MKIYFKLSLILFCSNLSCSDADKSAVTAGRIDFQAAFLANPNVQQFAKERRLPLTVSSLTNGELYHLFLALKKLGTPVLEALTYNQMNKEFTTHMIDISERQLRVAATAASKYLSHAKMLEIIAMAIKPEQQ